MAKIFPDSKTFVDMKLKALPNITLSKYNEWKVAHPNYTKDEIKTFVNVNIAKKIVLNLFI